MKNNERAIQKIAILTERIKFNLMKTFDKQLGEFKFGYGLSSEINWLQWYYWKAGKVFDASLLFVWVISPIIQKYFRFKDRLYYYHETYTLLLKKYSFNWYYCTSIYVPLINNPTLCMCQFFENVHYRLFKKRLKHEITWYILQKIKI